MWHVTHDMWHVTCDTWHITRDTWHMTFDLFGGWTFSQNFSSLALTVCDLWYYEDLEEKADWINCSINQWRGCLKNSPGYTGSVKKSWMMTGWTLFYIVFCFLYRFLTMHCNGTVVKFDWWLMEQWWMDI